mmetsp:Transcript_57545/g.171251  ORF Transcript_57545/g.171251 Transcript_57545/m.171251 type:complete len:239 (+) Transcript_57545:96-812(+)
MRVETSSKYPSSQLFLLTARVTSAPPTGLMNFKVISSFSSKLCFLFCSVATLDTLMATLRRFSVLTASLLSSSSCLACLFSSFAANSSALAAFAASLGVETSMTSLSATPNAAAVLLGSSSRPLCVNVAEESLRPSLAERVCMRTCSRMARRNPKESSGPYAGRTVRFKSSPYLTRSPGATPSLSSLLASREVSRTSVVACTRAESSRAEAAGTKATSKAMEIRRCILTRTRTGYQIR